MDKATLCGISASCSYLMCISEGFGSLLSCFSLLEKGEGVIVELVEVAQ